MTIKELIEKLSEIENKDLPVTYVEYTLNAEYYINVQSIHTVDLEDRTILVLSNRPV